MRRTVRAQGRVAICASAALMWVPYVQAPHAPVFSTRVDLVAVDVVVTRPDGRPVTNLHASDFQVLDQGLPQSAELIDASSIPLDLSLVLDTSGSTRNEGKHFWATIRTLAALLRPDDRIGLVTFGRTVHQMFALKPATARIAEQPLWGGAGSPLIDALFDAIATPVQKGRRHVILAMTDGGDIGSVLGPDQLTAAAARSDAVMYVGLARHPDFRGIPFMAPALDRAVKDICMSSGGAVLNSSGDDVVETFRRMVALLDHTYLLTYAPKNVPPEGWHTITVKVTKPGGDKYTVRARRGYFGG